ncbi:mycofactocin biosynthesis glycosyltransferase MftF [Nocardia sp. NPDC004711]
MRIHLDSGVRRFGDGRILLGGSPTRLLRLGATGARLLDSWLSNSPVRDEPSSQALARRLLDTGMAHPAVEPDSSAEAVATLVVPVRDNPDGLNRLLAATSDMPNRVVVDDGSVPPLRDANLRHEHPRGPAAARNTGWHCATTPLVAFLDSDTLPSTDWLDSILPLFNDPAVAAVAPRVKALTTGPVGHYEAYRSALDMGAEPALVHPASRVRYVPSAALVVRTSALRAINGFDESLRFGEDVDLVWRLQAAGFSVRYQPLSTVHHQPRGTIRGFLRQRFDYGTSAAPLARRHPGSMYGAVLPFSFGIQIALFAAEHPVATALPGIVSTAQTTWRLHRRQVPLRIAITVAASARLALIKQLADALRRIWWPVAMCSGRGRRLLAVAYAVAATQSVLESRSGLLRIADDLAYGSGVWVGCLRHRTLIPLTPRFRRAGESR